MENTKAKKVILVVVIVLLIIILGILVWKYFQIKDSTELKNNQQSTEINEKNIKIQEQEKQISEQAIKIQEQEKQISEQTIKIQEQEKLKDEQNTKIENLEKNIKEQKTEIEKLNKDLSSLKAGLTKRVSLKNSVWDRSGGRYYGAFYFNDLGNVKKIAISFSDGYTKADVVEAGTGNKKLELVLDKDKKIGTIAVGINDLRSVKNSVLEVYYNDGRTETIVTPFALG